MTTLIPKKKKKTFKVQKHKKEKKEQTFKIQNNSIKDKTNRADRTKATNTGLQ